jgi:hypothetical protein
MVLIDIRFLFAYANSDQNGEGCQEVSSTAGSSPRRQSQLPVGRRSARNVALRLVRVSFRYADLQVELSRNEPSRRPARATPIDAAVY